MTKFKEKMLNARVERRGGHQYSVTIDDATRIVDLDGCTVVSDEDMLAIEAAGIPEDDTMWSPSMWNLTDDDDYHFAAALRTAANYSGFDCDAYIAENK